MSADPERDPCGPITSDLINLGQTLKLNSSTQTRVVSRGVTPTYKHYLGQNGSNLRDPCGPTQ